MFDDLEDNGAAGMQVLARPDLLDTFLECPRCHMPIRPVMVIEVDEEGLQFECECPFCGCDAALCTDLDFEIDPCVRYYAVSFEAQVRGLGSC